MPKPPTGPSLSNPESLPYGEYTHEGRLKIVIAGLDQNIRAHALESANQKLADKLGESGFKGFLNKIWHGNVAREYYVAKYAKEASKNITESGNVFQNEGLSADEYKVATTLRFVHEYDGLIHEAAGEHRHVVDRNEDGSVNVEGYELKQHLFDLMGRFAEGEFDGPTPDDTERNFNEDASRLITELIERGLISKEHVGEARVRLDNMYQISQNVRAMIDHGVGLDEIAQNTDIVLGEAKVGARSEADLSRTERLVEKLSGKAWINESTVVPAAAIAVSAAVFATKTGASMTVAALAGVAVPGALSGVWAGVRESARYKRELSQLKRDIETGKVEATEGSVMRSAESLIDQLGVLYDENGELRIDDYEGLNEALTMIAECDSRVYLTDTEKPLISNASEMDRFNLDMALAKVKIDLGDLMERQDALSLAELGYSEEDIKKIMDSDNPAALILEPYIDAADGMLREQINDSNRAERAAHRKRVGLAILKGTGMGLLIGGAAQEASSLVLDNTQGVIEGQLGKNVGADKHTLLQGIINRGSYEGLAAEAGVEQAAVLGPGINAYLPEGFHMTIEGGSATLTGPGGLTIDHLSLTEDGHLTPESEHILSEKGFDVSSVESVDSINVEQETVVSAREYLNNHQDNVTRVTRDFWYTNAIEGRADGAELGIGGISVDANGNYVIDISGMDGHSTSPNGQSIDWQQLAREGKLSLALSASSGTQSEVIMLDVNPDGQIVIDKDSFEASLFGEHDGQPVFNAKFAEIVEVSGQDANGVTHIRPLATEVGMGNSTFVDKIQTTENIKSTSYNFIYTAPGGPQVAPPVFAPVYARGRTTAAAGERKAPGVPLFYEQPRVAEAELPPMPQSWLSPEERAALNPEEVVPSAEVAQEEQSVPKAEEVAAPQEAVELPPDKFQPAEDYRQQWEFEMSPTIEENPDAQLDINQELDRYIADQVIRRGREYANNIEALNKEVGLSGLISSETEAIVCTKIEVGTEGSPIYDVLAAYSAQSQESKNKSVFLLDVAWSASVVDDPEVSGLFERMNADLERARADFPDLKVAAYPRDWRGRESVTENDSAKERYDLAVFAAESALSEGRRNLHDDLLIISNDNNAQTITTDYLDKYLSEFENNPETDVFTGAFRREGAATPGYPGYDVVMNFLSNLEVEHQRENPEMSGYVVQNGSNMAFRMSAYAAVGGCAGEAVRADDEICHRVINAREGAIYGRPIMRHVADAQVTATLANDESLAQYQRDNWVADPFDAVDQEAAVAGPEDPQNNPDSVIERIEFNVNSYINNLPNKPEVIENALINTFGPISGSSAAFTMRWSRDYTRAQFNLTDSGRRQLLQKMTGQNSTEENQAPEVQSAANGLNNEGDEASAASEAESVSEPASTSEATVTPVLRVGDVFVAPSGVRFRLEGIDGRGRHWLMSLMPDTLTPYPRQPKFIADENRLRSMLASGDYRILR